MDSIIPDINETISAIKDAETAYNEIINSNQLKMSFHQAGKHLAIVKSTLKKIKLHIECGNRGGDEDAAYECIRECCDNAGFLQRAFANVASVADEERDRAYRIYLKRQGKEYRVEVSALAMMVNTCKLAEHAIVENEAASELRSLRLSIRKFDQMISKQDEEDEGVRGTGGATHRGIGDVYQSQDNATQNNIRDSGQQNFAVSEGGWPQNRRPA
ncbi:hypothetical protein NW768_004854 [Fusarium equiseti]|uniref:NACHT-NTPase and P-loop NTPases N-terminal domain-containing protein n=1 Tax=Fusarium equiseti TaxID=61235 RepID=A0ABQ8RHI9_FUSEQ|nr:hypothetical protein NW768_004854 [Fusarium equiseti]